MTIKYVAIGSQHTEILKIHENSLIYIWCHIWFVKIYIWKTLIFSGISSTQTNAFYHFRDVVDLKNSGKYVELQQVSVLTQLVENKQRHIFSFFSHRGLLVKLPFPSRLSQYA